jgi:hypothetical protein
MVEECDGLQGVLVCSISALLKCPLRCCMPCGCICMDSPVRMPVKVIRLEAQ